MDDNKFKESLGIVYALVGLGLVLASVLYLFQRKEDLVVSKIVPSFKTENEMVNYTLGFIRLIRTKNQPGNILRLEGMLKKFTHQINENIEAPSAPRLLAMPSRTEELIRDDDLEENYWFECLSGMLRDSIDRFPTSSRLRVLFASVCFCKLRNKWRALYALQETTKLKWTIGLQFTVYRLERLIEKEIDEAESRSIDTGIDLFRIFEFKNAFSTFQIEIGKTVKLQQEFWSELIDETPNIQKLISLASTLTKKFEELEVQFNSLGLYEVNSHEYLHLYSTFLRDIIHDDFENKRVAEKLELLVKNRSGQQGSHDDKNDNTDDNANGMIITCSGNKVDLGNIVNIGNEVTEILGYKPSELIAKSVNVIMPHFYAQNHQKYMQKYIETGEAKTIGKKRFFYCLDRKGYIRGCSTFVKVLPDLSEGLRFVGLIRDFEGINLGKPLQDNMKNVITHNLIFDSATGEIMGISQSLFAHFGLKYI